MKTPLITFLFVLTTASFTYAQRIEATLTERIRVFDATNTPSRLEAGDRAAIEGYSFGVGPSGGLGWKLETGIGERYMSPRNFNALQINYAELSTRQIWRLALLRSRALEDLNKFGKGFNIRSELEEEYVSLETQFDFITDPYLDDYLSNLLRDIYAGPLPLDRYGNLNIRLYRANEPSAFACSNGAIYLSSGLLSTLRTEDELAAIIANQVAHVVLDHSVYNYHVQERKLARAQFWGSLITVAAGVGEAAARYNAYSKGYGSYLDYEAGTFTNSMSNLAYAVAYAAATRLGMEYTVDQYNEADWAAALILESQGRDRRALATALGRILEYYAETRNFQILSEDPRLQIMRNRRNAMEQHETMPAPDLDYLRHISLLNLITATQEYALNRYERARELTQLNIDAGVAVPEDFMLQSAVIRRLHTAPEELEKAFTYLAQAEARARMLPREYHIEKALVHLRLGQLPQAKTALEAYQAKDPYAAAASYEAESAMQWWVRNMLEKL